MKSCDEVQDVLPELLPWVRGPAFEVHEHLRLCPECADLADDLAHTLHVLESSPGAPALGEAFAERVVQALPHDPGWSVGGRPAGRVIRLRTLLVQGAAAAACFAAGAALTLGLRPANQGGGPSDGLAGVQRLPHGQPQVVVVGEPADQPRRRGVRRAPDLYAPAEQVWAAEPAPGSFTTGPATTGPVTGWAAPVRLAGYEGRPLVRYMSQAGLVVEAVADLDASADPRALQVLRVTIQGSDLLDEGDQLLQLLPPEPDEPSQAELRRLIAGTQLVLRKVRNARQDAAPELLWALRREVRETGLLDAYRELLTHTGAATPEPEPPVRPRQPNDPL